MFDATKNVLVNLNQTDKIEYLRAILSINISIFVAAIGLVFLLYQIDKYNKFKHINYVLMLCYAITSVSIGLLSPFIYIHASYVSYADNLYALSSLSPFVMVVISAVYLLISLRSLSTTRIIKKFQHTDKLVLRLEKLRIKLINKWIVFLNKTVEREKPNKRAKLSTYDIGRNQNPIAEMAELVCQQHGTVMQEWKVAKLSPLSTRDDLMIRIASTAMEVGDLGIFRQVIARYAHLLSQTDDHFDEYEEDLGSIGTILIRRGRYDLYDLMLDDLSIAWMKDKEAFALMEDRVCRLYTALLAQIIDDADDIQSIQKAMTRLMNIHFLILQADGVDGRREWFYSLDACAMYVNKSALRIAEKEHEYTLWLMYEKSAYYAHHGAEANSAGMTIAYMKVISNIGIAGRVYDLHCGATDCSKKIYDHAVETFEELGAYFKDTFKKEDTQRYISGYKDAFEKLTGYNIDLDLKSGKYTVLKNKPKSMHTVKLGPTKATSDTQEIDYSKLDKQTLRRLLVSRKAGW